MSDYSRLVRILETVVGFKSVTGNARVTAECLNYAENILDRYGWHLDRYISNGFESLVATTRRTRKPRLLLQSHIDVVPADDDMFVVRGEGSNLCGRGVYDMKYALACYLELAHELGTRCSEYDIGIMLTSDEEQDGRNGTKFLLDQGYAADVCLLPDGGDNWRLEYAAKGVWTFDVEAHGTSAHASRPWNGDNAATKLMSFLQEVSATAPAKNHTDTTLVVSVLSAGEQGVRNQVPDVACASIDIRYLNEAAYQDIYKKIVPIADRHSVTLMNERIVAATEFNLDIPIIRSWQESVREIRGDLAPEGHSLSFGASDARFFAAYDIPVIVTRPDGGAMHGSDEWINEAGFYQFYDCIRAYVEKVAIEPDVQPRLTP